MTFFLLLEIDGKSRVGVSLWKKLEGGREQKIDEIMWKDKNDLSSKLLIKIDSLLKKNKIKLTSLGRVKIKSENGNNTSSRIAKITARMFNYCLTNSEK